MLKLSFAWAVWVIIGAVYSLGVQTTFGNCYEPRVEAGCSNDCLSACVCDNSMTNQTLSFCCSQAWNSSCIDGIHISNCDVACPLTNMPALFNQSRSELNVFFEGEPAGFYVQTTNLTALIETAEDFQVPNSVESWDVFGMQFRGLAFVTLLVDGATLTVDQLNDSSVILDWTLTIYENGLALPDPNEVIANLSGLTPINGPNNPYFVFEEPLELAPGLYWVEVYPRLNIDFFQGNTSPSVGWGNLAPPLEGVPPFEQTLALRDVSNLLRPQDVLLGDLWVPVSVLTQEPDAEIEFIIFGQRNTSQSLSAGAIAGIVIGVFFFCCCATLLIALLLIFFFNLQHNRDRIFSHHESGTELRTTSNSEAPHALNKRNSSPYANFAITLDASVTSSSLGEREMPHSPTWEINYNDLKFGEVIGQGAYGIVYRGTWRQTDVAIKKMLTQSMSEKDHQAFLFETNLMKNLRPHNNVITLLGVVTKPPCVVTLYMQGGNLYNYLHSSETISEEQMLAITVGIAKGMLHLELEKIVHRDLAARNILLDSMGTPKISDFGLSRYGAEGAKTETDIGPIKWMAPECMLNKEYSSKSDVWAFAITVVEVFTRDNPYPNENAVVISSKVLNEREKFKPPTPQNAPPFLRELMADCWHFNPTERPSFSDIVDSFNKNLKKG